MTTRNSKKMRGVRGATQVYLVLLCTGITVPSFAGSNTWEKVGENQYIDLSSKKYTEFEKVEITVLQDYESISSAQMWGLSEVERVVMDCAKSQYQSVATTWYSQRMAKGNVTKTFGPEKSTPIPRFQIKLFAALCSPSHATLANPTDQVLSPASVEKLPKLNDELPLSRAPAQRGQPIIRPEVPVVIKDSSVMEDGCGNGVVIDLDSNGDGFLAVKGGPGLNYQRIDKLYNGEQIYLCTQKGDWYGIVYSKRQSECNVNIGWPVSQPYTGPCRSGWAYRRWIKLIAG